MVKHNVRGILGFSITHCRGLPFWLHNVQGIVFRTDNEPFKVINLLNSDGFLTSMV